MTRTIVTRRAKTNPDSLPNDLHPVLRRVYAHRGVTSAQELEKELRALLPVQMMDGADLAARRLLQAIEQQQRILMVGDFDCDGATSTALSVLALRAMGAAHVDYLLPDRFRFGYGLSPELVAEARSRQPDLMVTVDNGVSSIEGVAAANAAGIDVIITDHHLPGETLPQALAIVNPNLHDNAFPAKSTAGVGVIFYVLLALRALLREAAHFHHRPEPNMADYLDLVALGTVADVVPLEHNNRILVHQGIGRIRARRCRPGILALLEVAGRAPETLAASDLGFVLGPRLNAAGRLEDMTIGVECLLAEDEDEARAIAQRLDTFNRERRVIEDNMRAQAEAMLEQLDWDSDELPWGLCLHQADWHQGVIGILASRIKERYHRPVIVFASDGNGELKGSGRSIPSLHLRDALAEVDVRAPGLLRKFGGHAMAAGLSLPAAALDAFRACFDEVVRERLDETDLQAVLWSDGQLAAEDFDLQLAEALEAGGPWGQGFPEPLFHGCFEVMSQRLLKERHWKLSLRLPDSEHWVDGIAFNLAEQFPETLPQRVMLVYKLNINHFRGQRNLQLLIEHLEAA